jgi:hypothetical protein
VTDLEQQRRALTPDPSERSVSGGGQIPNLTIEQRALCHGFHAYLLASAIERCTNRDGRWFSAGGLALSSDCMSIVHHGESLGLWRRNSAKPYWTHTAATWPWVRTAIALFDEQTRAESGQRG